MELVALILAHKARDQLAILLDVLDSLDIHCLIHLDRKVGTPRSWPRYGQERVTYIEQRERIVWGGISMVDATLALARRALASGAGTHFALMSGQCLPVRRPHVCLGEHGGKGEMIDLISMPNLEFDKPLERLNRYWIAGDPDWRWVYAVNRIAGLLPRRDTVMRRGLRPFAGNQWWILSRHALEYVLAENDRLPWYRSVMANTLCPDESYIHTLLGNSDYLPLARGTPTYIDWSRRSAHPEVLSADDVRRIPNRYCFARKFDAVAKPSGVEAALNRLQREPG